MLHGPKTTQRKARVLRWQLTLPEVMLWQQLRQSPAGLRFRRQHPAGPYVLDFFCATRLLAIEVDGAVHDLDAQWQHDLARDAWLVRQGVLVMRLPGPRRVGGLRRCGGPDRGDGTGAGGYQGCAAWVRLAFGSACATPPSRFARHLP
jgi:very-short-patch-repair endonuclease